MNKLLNLKGSSTKLAKETKNEIQHSTALHHTDIQRTASLAYIDHSCNLPRVVSPAFSYRHHLLETNSKGLKNVATASLINTYLYLLPARIPGNELYQRCSVCFNVTIKNREQP